MRLVMLPRPHEETFGAGVRPHRDIEHRGPKACAHNPYAFLILRRIIRMGRTDREKRDTSSGPDRRKPADE
jgi:hypothetical protein